jgi:aspartokinase
MAPLVPLGTEIRVRNSFRPAAPGTRISAHGDPSAGVRAVTARGPFTADELACLLAGDCGAGFFRARNGHPGPRITTDLGGGIPALELPTGDLLERLTGFAGAGRRPLALVSLVGAGMPAVSHRLQRVGEALKGLPVLQIAQRSCDTHSSLLVPAELELEAVQRVHRVLLEEEGAVP